MVREERCLLPTSVTLNDLERLFCIVSPNSIALQADYVKVVKHRPITSAEYRLPLLAKTDPPCSEVSLR